MNEMLNVRVKIYDGVKYSPDAKKVTDVDYFDILGFEIVTGERATQVGLQTDESSRDEYNEYLIITLKDGDKATFGNSHVDLFRL